MRTLAATVIVLALAGSLHAQAAGQPLEIPLSVTEAMGLPRTAAPISGGIPLPRGLVPKDQVFALFRDTGEELPLQAMPLVVERDDSLRWVLLDFQDDIPAKAIRRYVLKAVAPTAKPPVALTVNNTADAVTVNTGKMTLTVSRTKPFALFDSVTVGETTVATGAAVAYDQLHGRKAWNDPAPWKVRRFMAAPPESVTVHYAGRLRVTLEITGHFALDPLKAGYRAWITTWAGSSRVWVKVKITNSNPDNRTFIPIKRSIIDLATPATDGKVMIGKHGPALEVEGRAWLHQGLKYRDAWQNIPDAARAGVGDKTLWKGSGKAERPRGWVAARGTSNIFVCDRLFTSNPARRLEAGNGHIVLQGIAEIFDGVPDRKFKKDRLIGPPHKSPGHWLYDCSHHSSEYLFDFDAPWDSAGLNSLTLTGCNRLWATAPGSWYSQTRATAVGPFGTLADEVACYDKWGWTYAQKIVPNKREAQHAWFVGRVNNHGDSEADSVQGLLMMYLRTGQRGWFDEGEGWARYHADRQAWRTDGWQWKDGAIWFPGGGPQGNRMQRGASNFNFKPSWNERANDPDCYDLYTASKSKSCYCHYYGAGLADYYCLTGDRDALQAAIDNVETKRSEYRRYRNLTPGRNSIKSIRGFGRGLDANLRVLQADPKNDMVRDLCILCGETLWQSPSWDERGFHPTRIGGGYGALKLKDVPAQVKAWLAERGMQIVAGPHNTVDSVRKGSQQWKVIAYGGTWQHAYLANAAEQYAWYFDDEDLRDLTIAYAEMAAKYMLSRKCHQTWYYAYFDLTRFGDIYDPWEMAHETTDGQGCFHSGWFARFYPDVCARGYSLTGEKHLLDKAKDFWYYGSKRSYHKKHLRGKPNEMVRFASHSPPKDDEALAVSRMFFEVAHGRTDTEPPEAITDLSVKRLDADRAEIRFTAPADRAGGTVVRYQVKTSGLPIAPYDKWDSATDRGKRRNWWRAVNCRGEPVPSAPGTKERFVVTGLPEGGSLHFAVRSFDNASNRSAMSNLVRR
jgi:exo-rhamnogalacturonan lyase-like protein